MSKIPYDRTLAEQFINEHFDHYMVTSRGGGNEIEMLCPFCKGGRSQEESFNLNLRRGAGRCWRGKCSWQGSFVYFVKSYLDCDWATAYKIAGGEPPADIDELIGFLNTLNIDFEEEPFVFKDVEIYAWVESSQPVIEAENFDEISDWIENVRGYDVDEFLDTHELWVPKYKGRYDDRVIFKVRTCGRTAYLAYSYNPMLKRKTLNPPGQVLSNMLYNYDNVKNSSVVILTEGIFDAARAMSYDFAAMCGFGLAISDEQIFLLSELAAKEIVICYDHGCDHIAKALIKRIAPFMGGKTLSYMSIKKKGADPDDLTEEEFLLTFLARKKFLSSNHDKINNLLLGL